MANGTEVLREYLLSLGFKVNTQEARRFDTTINKIGKSATLTGGAIVGIATAATAMVNVFAAQMERLYYASKRTGATVGNLQALEYGAKAIGISGEQMTGALMSMARTIRNNPGLNSVLQQLGVKVEGRDASDVAKDTVRALSKMPYYVGAKFAGLFGIDEDTFFMMSKNMDKLDEFMARRKEMAREMGVDSDAAAEAALKYRNTIGELIERFGLLKDAASIALLPAFQEAASITREVLNDWVKIANSHKGFGDFVTKLREGATGRSDGDRVELSADSKARLAEQQVITSGDGMRRFRMMMSGYGRGGFGAGRANFVGGGRGFVNPNTVSGGGGDDKFGSPTADVNQTDPKYAQALFARLEKQYGLPAGLLDRVWAAESNRGQSMLSSAGAKGHFQFMPKTAAEYGINGMEDDLDASAEAAAQKYKGLLRRYGGDVSKAAAAYNWGEGNMAGVGDNLGSAPAETQGYAAKVGGIQQRNNFYITGTDAQGIADAVGSKLNSTNNQLVSDFKGAIR